MFLGVFRVFEGVHTRKALPRSDLDPAAAQIGRERTRTKERSPNRRRSLDRGCFWTGLITSESVLSILNKVPGGGG